MAIPGSNSKEGELEDVCKNTTEKTLVIYNADSEETRENNESTSDVEIISRDSALHKEHEEAVDITNTGTEISIVVSGYPLVQFGSGSKVLKVQSCKNRCKNCYSSSEEEIKQDSLEIEEAEEVYADSYAHDDLKRKTNCSEMIYSVMPVIQKRGCMNTFHYDSLITKLKYLQDKGDFVGHEQMVEKEFLKSRLAADRDMEVSLQIERAMALYFQNNIKDAKVILKLVVKQEKQLKNPGILVGRALNLLTAIYKRQGKFGNAMKCVTRANRCLECHASPDDKAELHQSYAALLTALPAAKDRKASQTTKKEAYKSYEMAGHYTGSEEFREYVHVKMAALLLESRCTAERTVTFYSKEDILKAKKHLDFVENKVGDDMALGTRIKLLLLRSDQHLCEDQVAMAIEKAQEANELIHGHGFQLELNSAKKRIDHLSALQKKVNEHWRMNEYCFNDDLTDSQSAYSE